MRDILDHCAGLPVTRVPGGTVLLPEGARTGRAYVLVDGRIEVLRGDTQIAVCDEPGMVVGEMSALLDAPHTATARALDDAKVIAIEDAAGFLREHPAMLWQIAGLLARRLNAATGYVADLKRQFADREDHLAMMGEVLEALLYEPDRAIDPGSLRDPNGT
ncbi:MAG: Crp/Fnr family transcriptional regulator [Proteobacteria bacterium]|nr:Crp/Fnr family transcriptional regulator [Pseudomonadota bacterium]